MGTSDPARSREHARRLGGDRLGRRARLRRPRGRRAPPARDHGGRERGRLRAGRAAAGFARQLRPRRRAERRSRGEARESGHCRADDRGVAEAIAVSERASHAGGRWFDPSRAKGESPINASLSEILEQRPRRRSPA